MRRLLVVVLLLAGALTVRLPAAFAATYIVPPTIDPTGTTEVSAALNAWIASVPNGSDSQHRATILFPLGAVYWSEAPVQLVQKSWTTFDGNGGTVEVKTPCTSPASPCDTIYKQYDRANLQLWSSTNVTVRNLTTLGANPNPGHYNANYEGQAGIAIYSGSNISVYNNTFKHPYGDGVYLDFTRNESCSYDPFWVPCGLPEGAAPSSVTVGVQLNNGSIGNTIIGAGRHGLTVTAGSSITFQRNTMTSDTSDWSVGYWAVDIEPDTTGKALDHLTIKNNNFGAPHTGVIAASGPVGSSDVLIDANTVEADPQAGRTTNGFAINISGTDIAPGNPLPTRWTISNNVSHALYGWAPRQVWVRSMTYVTVSANTMPCLVGDLGQRFNATETANTDHVSILNNTFSGCATVNTDSGSTNLTLSGNVL